jgi:ATP-binding protein involved in chromosome partitioning
MTSIEEIRERLTEIRSPGVDKDIVALGAVRSIDRRAGEVVIQLQLPALPESSINATVADIRRAIGAFDDVTEVHVHLVPPAQATPPAGGAFENHGPLPGVRDIVAVSSTKGGVGKSTVATNLAMALRRHEKRVGLLDADVYGPSLPTMLGIRERPRMSSDKRIVPLDQYGVKVMSVGFFLDDKSPVIWRGPLVMGLVRQFLRDVEWGELDVLVIDLPPGTGDAALTLVQQVPVAGGVVVTTPQAVATLDVERGIAMFRQVNTPVFGIVENMSFYQCPKCGKKEYLFGSGGAQRIAERFHVPVLGQLPLTPEVRISGDQGKPIVLASPDHVVSQSFMSIAAKVIDAVEAERLASAPPSIVG